MIQATAEKAFETIVISLLAMAGSACWGADVFSVRGVNGTGVFPAKHIFELRAGKVLPIVTHWSKVHQGYCDHGLIVTENAVVRWKRFGQKDFKDTSTNPDMQAFFHFFDRTTGEPLGVGTLPISPKDGLSPERRAIEEHDRDWWRWLGVATPWAEGGRPYVRAHDFLWCIGDPGKPWISPDAMKGQ